MNAMVLLSVASAFFMGTNQEVVQSFNNKCDNFFFQNTEPAGFENNYEYICQVYNNQNRYATLFDQQNLIPVYSAYIYQDNNCTNRMDSWKLEPQLADSSWPKEMMTIIELVNKTKLPLETVEPKIEATQAVREDYVNSGFDIGHLNPVCHQNGADNKTATCTFTNAAPMPHGFNVRWFHQYENLIRKNLSQQCHQGSVFIVTGTIPDSTQKIKNRVSIPSVVWSAMCCQMNNGSYLSIAAYGINTDTGTIDTTLTVAQLNIYLSRAFGSTVSIFNSTLC
uniref:Endonuclease domain-containing 1 protein-like n=1 Tax=Latimeria chalumnae TaxID=7897 RepID=H2ZSB1_LATCH